MLPLAPNDPSVIDRYQLLAALGQGGMGRVYLAIGPDGKRLAVKQILPHLANDPGFQRRFGLEVEAARKVAGPHTVPVVDADTSAEAPWSATEFVPGPTLIEAISREGRLPADFVRALGAQLAAALGSVHDAGLIHRDLKPSNVLLSPEGAKLLDFGISRAVDYSTSVALTQTGGVVGSPGYMSPEQAESRALSQKSDIFSLGSLLATAATGRAPFESPSIPQVLYKLVHEEPDLAEVPESLRETIARCLSKDPEQRPGAAELRELWEASGEVATESLPVVDNHVARQEAQIVALRPVSHQYPTMVDTGALPRPHKAMSGRNKALIAGGAALALLLLIAIPVALLLPDTSEGEDATAGDTAGQDDTPAELRMPEDVCDAFDMDAFHDLIGRDAAVEEEPHSDPEEPGYQSCSAMLIKDEDVASLLIMVEDMSESSSEVNHVKCQLEGCDGVTASSFPYGGESDARPWDKGGLVKEPSDLSMMWYQGDFAVWVAALPELGRDGQVEQDFFMEQGIAVYDLLAQD